MCLAAGTTVFGFHQDESTTTPNPNTFEIDILWLQNASNAINEGKLDGWALHTYGSPWFRYEESPGPSCVTLCIDANHPSLFSCGNHSPALVGDASFR